MFIRFSSNALGSSSQTETAPHGPPCSNGRVAETKIGKFQSPLKANVTFTHQPLLINHVFTGNPATLTNSLHRSFRNVVVAPGLGVPLDTAVGRIRVGQEVERKGRRSVDSGAHREAISKTKFRNHRDSDEGINRGLGVSNGRNVVAPEAARSKTDRLLVRSRQDDEYRDLCLQFSPRTKALGNYDLCLLLIWYAVYPGVR
jgi:hypothetical protein